MPTTRVKLSVNAVSHSYWMLDEEYRLCAHVSIHFFIHSHYHGCLSVSAERLCSVTQETAVLMSPCVSLLCPRLLHVTIQPFLTEVIAY